MEISRIIRNWYQKHKRDLPWRDSGSPYLVWLSEVIFQQTRIDQGMPYYLRFSETFPTLKKLAHASRDEVLKLWQGLGYYTRARNLHETARHIHFHLKDKFPDTYDELLKLKGVGPYTAAAVASIAFKRPVAVVDGNVARLLTRLFAVSVPVDSSDGKNMLTALANELLDQHDPGTHNQAFMEFGSLICVPHKPKCGECVVNTLCLAYEQNLADEIPVKQKKTPVRNRYFHYLDIRTANRILLRKRNQKDIWHSLYDFPMIETVSVIGTNVLMKHDEWKRLFKEMPIRISSRPVYMKHQLTHQTLHCYFYQIYTELELIVEEDDIISIRFDEIQEYAVPRVIERYLDGLANKAMS